MSLSVFAKWPTSKRDYTIKWALWLGTDTIASCDFTADSGVEIVSHSHDATTSTVWLKGGTAGQRYRITNSIVTVAGREESKSFYLDVKDES